jgi:phosphatidylglycerol:prolipoprotein diacylglycerol transferase
MDFPLYIPFGPFRIHPHFLFETLSYFIGFQVYRLTRSKQQLPASLVAWIVTGAIVGAALGSKMLYWFEDPIQTLHKWNDIVYMIQGKTIVGGLLGGWIGVEIVKKMIGWKYSTGDDIVPPLVIGMSIGRIGCFLTGLDDHTYGIATTWWTGIDFGDGILRHPTQLYEIVFLWLLFAVLAVIRKRWLNRGDGEIFRLFMVSYLAFRFGIDFIKPTLHPYLGLNNVQLACVLGIMYLTWEFTQNTKKMKKTTKMENTKEVLHA